MARPRVLRNQAQHKHGLDLWRSIYYREDWGQPWQKIAKTFAPLQRWALRKSQKPASIYRRLKHHEQHGQTLSRHAA